MLYFNCLQPYFLAQIAQLFELVFLILVATAKPPQPKSKKQRVRKAGIAPEKIKTILQKMFDTKDKDSEQ